MTAVNASSLAELTGPGFLRALLGPIESLDRRPLGALGYSGSTHERLEIRLGSGERRNLVFKHVRLAQDWTAYRTGDTLSREAALLAEPALDRVWDVFACPYLAHAVEEGEIGLLLQDVSEHLFPDVDEPLTEAQEDALLAALATLHAQYWNADIWRIAWLATPAHLFTVLGPRAGEEESRRPTPHPLLDMVRQGWAAALARLPEAASARLTRSADDFARECSTLPRTLLHGDAKVANFALLTGGTCRGFRLGVDWCRPVHAGPRLVPGRQCWASGENERRRDRPVPWPARSRARPQHPYRPLGAAAIHRFIVWGGDVALGEGARAGIRHAAGLGRVGLVGEAACLPSKPATRDFRLGQLAKGSMTKGLGSALGEQGKVTRKLAAPAERSGPRDYVFPADLLAILLISS